MLRMFSKGHVCGEMMRQQRRYSFKNVLNMKTQTRFVFFLSLSLSLSLTHTQAFFFFFSFLFFFFAELELNVSLWSLQRKAIRFFPCRNNFTWHPVSFLAVLWEGWMSSCHIHTPLPTACFSIMIYPWVAGSLCVSGGSPRVAGSLWFVCIWGGSPWVASSLWLVCIGGIPWLVFYCLCVSGGSPKWLALCGLCVLGGSHD